MKGSPKAELDPLMALLGQAPGTRLQLLARQAPSPVAAAALAADGTRVVVGSRGAHALAGE